MAQISIAIIIVGNEFLKCQADQKFSQQLIRRLLSVGLRVSRISIISGEVVEIANEVRTLSERYKYVIIIGGIDSWNNDVTYEGVAQAVGQSLISNGESQDTAKVKKIKVLPKAFTTIPVAGSRTLIRRVRNIFILPNLLKWCEALFSQLKNALEVGNTQYFLQDLKIKTDEVNIANLFQDGQLRFRETVNISAFLFLSDETILTRITMESYSLESVCDARTFFLNGLPPNLVDHKLTTDDAQKVWDLAYGDSSLSKAVANSLEVIKQGLKEYDARNTVLSFNGGKDCTVLLHLLWSVYSVSNLKPVKMIYITCENPFQEIDDFIEECVTRYDIELKSLAGPIKPALEALVAERSTVQAVWMGTRRTDPYSASLHPLQMCDSGWPEIMRINPLLDWSYEDIWTFIRMLPVSYCKLYDEGFTSLGHMKNTKKNPLLIDPVSNAYLPAYKLKDGSQERLGRQS